MVLSPTVFAILFGWWRTTKRSGLLDAVWEENYWGPGGILQDGFQKYTVGNHVNDLGIHYNLDMMSVQTKEMRHRIWSAVARGQLSGSVQHGSWHGLCKGGLVNWRRWHRCCPRSPIEWDAGANKNHIIPAFNYKGTKRGEVKRQHGVEGGLLFQM